MKFRNTLFKAMLLVIVGASIHATPAQRKLLSLSEYSESTFSPPAKSREMTRRINRVEETYSEGAITKTVESISESVLKGGARFYSKTVEVGKITENETIYLNGVWYVRENGKAWRIEPQKFGIGVGGGLSVPPAGKQYSVEPVFLNGLPSQLFEAFFINEKDKELIFQEQRMWVGQDGLVYREEYVAGKLWPRTETSRSVTTYEYDPNINIEAPIK